MEGADANVQRAVRLLRLFNEQLQALASLGGRQVSKKSLWSMFTCTRVAKRSLKALQGSVIHPGGGKWKLS